MDNQKQVELQTSLQEMLKNKNNKNKKLGIIAAGAALIGATALPLFSIIPLVEVVSAGIGLLGLGISTSFLRTMLMTENIKVELDKISEENKKLIEELLAQEINLSDNNDIDKINKKLVEIIKEEKDATKN